MSDKGHRIKMINKSLKIINLENERKMLFGIGLSTFKSFRFKSN